MTPLPPLMIASVADDGLDDAADAADIAAANRAAPPATVLAAERSEVALHDLCERLAWWIGTRRLYGAPRVSPSIMAKLRSPMRVTRSYAGLDIETNMELAALYIALVAQPADALDRRVFELHYLHRVRHIKTVAAELGIGRQHWYTLLSGFRRRIYVAARQIMDANVVELERMRGAQK
jgi:hypothetical protein